MNSLKSLPSWVIGKIMIWLALGGLVALAYKQQMARKVWLAVPVLVAAAAVLAIVKP